MKEGVNEMASCFPDGVYPTMLLPCVSDDEIDYGALEKLLAWYLDHGASGIFALCHSTEIHCMSMDERITVLSYVKQYMELNRHKNGTWIPVVAAGTYSSSIEEQAEEICRIHEAGADDVVIITNRLDPNREGENIFIHNLESLLKRVPDIIPLGFYECPQPYKRVISVHELSLARDSGRFYFMKDTCCDPVMLDKRLECLCGSRLKLFNANAQTLLYTLLKGASGYSSCMANVHPDLYAWLIDNYKKYPVLSRRLQEFLTFSATYEFYAYPLNAKYLLNKYEHVPIEVFSRMRSKDDFDAYNIVIADQMKSVTDLWRSILSEPVTSEMMFK